MKQYVVLGLGIFGKSIVANLMKKPGVEVFAVDKNMHLVDEVKDIATQAIRLDSTQREALESIEINKFDAVILTIGQQDMMASILTALLLKEMNVSCIIARYINEQHRAILERIGIDELVNPEEKMGEEIAKNIVSANTIPCFELFEQYAIEEIKIDGDLIGKSISDIDTISKHNVRIIAIKTEQNIQNTDDKNFKTNIDIIIDENKPLAKNDVIIAIGSEKNIIKFRKYCKS